MDELRLKARAKINLTLDVTGRRENGYHDVRMIMQSIALYDGLTMRKIPEPRVELTTNLKYLPTDDNNLVCRAVQSLIRDYDLREGVSIHLDKRIPVAAGLAGGSSDAATALFGMNRLFDLRMSKQEMMERGLALGADVPFCLLRGTVLAEGIGEILTKLPACPHYYVLLMKPAFGVSTKRVYENLDMSTQLVHPNVDAMVAGICRGNKACVWQLMGNVLEQVTIPMHPVIAQMKMDLIQAGAVGSMMSGSGPTVFGLFETKEMVNQAFLVLRNRSYIGQIYQTEFYDPVEAAKQGQLYREQMRDARSNSWGNRR